MVVFWTFVGTSVALSKDGQWEFDRDRGIAVRIVELDESWQNVAKEVREHIKSQYPGEEPRVGFYGHGGLVSPEEAVKNDLPFVKALGLAARMHVMIFPKLPFPEKNTLKEIPKEALKRQLKTPLKPPIATLTETTTKALGSLAYENLYATAHAAVRILEGVSAFNKAFNEDCGRPSKDCMSLSLAGFSDSVEAIVKMGQLLENRERKIWDGYRDIQIPEDVLKDVYLDNIVTFGAHLPPLFPKFKVSDELLRRVRGKFTNIVPEESWKQWMMNRQIEGEGVENFPIKNAPVHGEWSDYLKSSKSHQALLETIAPFFRGEKPVKLNRDRRIDLSPLSSDDRKKYIPGDDGGGGGGGLSPGTPPTQATVSSNEAKRAGVDCIKRLQQQELLAAGITTQAGQNLIPPSGIPFLDSPLRNPLVTDLGKVPPLTNPLPNPFSPGLGGACVGYNARDLVKNRP